MPHFGFRGMPLPYGTTCQPPEPGVDWVDWAADKTASWGLSPLYSTVNHLRDEAEAREFGKRLADKGLGYIASGGGQFAGTPEQWQRDSARFINQIKKAKAAGAKIMAAVNADPESEDGQPWPNGGTYYGHFSKYCPIGEQIDRMVGNFREIVKVCEDLELVLAFENHMDYRISEIVQVVERVDSPALRINYDYANSWAVIEDQVEAAKLAAPYTVMTHIKDMRAQSITNTGEPEFLHAPIGHGDVEIIEITQILQDNVPDPENLYQCMEVCPLAQYDPDLWMRISIEWLRDNAAHYFDYDFERYAPKN